MPKDGADDIRRGSVRETPPDTYPRGREPLQLPDAATTAQLWASTMRESRPTSAAIETDLGGEKVKS